MSKRPIRISASRLKTLCECSVAHCKCAIVCLSGVYLGAMCIYLITCLINGKRYVGRTVRPKPNRRWNEHRSAARRGVKCGIIPRAIRKHGPDAFTFEVIEWVERVEDLPAREAFWIAHHDCLSPKGYNLETYQPLRVLTEEGRHHCSLSQQGLKKRPNSSSRYVGVHRSNGRWAAMLTFNGVDYLRRFDTEMEASIAYDKLALSIVGPRATINHPDITYTEDELRAHHLTFAIPRTYSSSYSGVNHVLDDDRWRGVVRLPEGGTRVRVCLNELEAAQFVDVIRVLYLDASADTLNCPHLYDRYRQLDEGWLKARAYIPLTKGVTKRGNRYLGRLGNGGSLWYGSFVTREEAETAVAAKRKELGMTWDL